MKSISRNKLLGALALCAGSQLGTVSAGTPTEPTVQVPPASASSDWEFRVEPYGWLTGLEGTTGVSPLITELDQSFSDIFDYLEMAAALQFEARNGCWGFLADGFYAELGGEGSTPGPLYDRAEIDMKQFIGELAVAYRIYDSPSAFVDIYGGIRYNNLSMDLSATLDLPGIQTLSDNLSQEVVSGIGERAQAILQPKLAAYQNAAAARRSAIEAEVTSRIQAEAEARVKRDIQKQLHQIRRDGGLNRRDIASNRIIRAVKTERLALAQATAQLKVAELQASVNQALQNRVTRAQARVSQTQQNLATAINQQLVNGLPTSTSADKDWVDPILGVRAQWNLNDQWFLAGKSDIGGFGAGSDLTWTVQGTVGYRFTEKVSAELGYRYMDTDYQDGAFVYDIVESGVYTGLNIRF